MNRIFLVALAAVCLSFAGASIVRAEKDKSYTDITIPDLKKAIADKSAFIIDVNGSDSFKEGHIPTAVDFEANKDKLADLLPKDKGALVVAYCGGPQCSAYKAAVKAAQALGYTNIKHLPDGISGWKSAGEKTDNG